MTGYCRQVDRLLRSAAVVSPRAPDRFAVVWLLGQATVFGLFYGTVMGSFSGLSPDRLWQVVYSAAKMPLLLLATFSLSLPSFFVINTLVGLREDFGDAVRALVTMQAVLTIILAALAPLTALWYASFSDYSAATAFNGLMFALATFSAQGMLRRTYCPLIARHPRHRAMLRVWLVT
ncbi:MAG: hypothetical protein ACKV0T_26050, partial [Planctomycetales bacterium]